MESVASCQQMHMATSENMNTIVQLNWMEKLWRLSKVLLRNSAGDINADFTAAMEKDN